MHNIMNHIMGFRLILKWEFYIGNEKWKLVGLENFVELLIML